MNAAAAPSTRFGGRGAFVRRGVAGPSRRGRGASGTFLAPGGLAAGRDLFRCLRFSRHVRLSSRSSAAAKSIAMPQMPSARAPKLKSARSGWSACSLPGAGGYGPTWLARDRARWNPRDDREETGQRDVAEPKPGHRDGDGRPDQRHCGVAVVVPRWSPVSPTVHVDGDPAGPAGRRRCSARE